ncbi:MAG: ABC transporter permease [Rhodanobacteraceae bacterium]
MGIHPMLSTMRRDKIGILLIVLQMALTLAILCNALFIIHLRLRDSARPSGIADEGNVLVVAGSRVGHPADFESRQQADLAALRALPGVADAYADFSYPLEGGGWGCAVRLVPTQPLASAFCSLYLVDDHARKVLGVRLLEGRWFRADEVVDRHENDVVPPAHVVIVTRALAQKLFPGGDALGKTVYMEGTPQTIVGIIACLQTPNVADGSVGIEYSVLQPNHYVGADYTYIVRVRRGRAGRVEAAAPKALRDLDGARIIRYVRTFPEVRAMAYRGSHGFAAVLATVCAILLAVVAFGIVGLTSSAVSRRRREIGIRRALGAMRRAILHQFQIEQFVVAIVACGIGVGLAIAVNLWLVDHYEMQRMPLLPMGVAALVMLVLGQAAVLWPALRAASVPPSLATKGGH